ncbi:O-Antigen ligase [Allorhodopirellula heiligendammensis]|uniref:O-Antigen ligase n=2 Tax=Allorhodopirellula heiligendammensis TaxID=2714739 RepID=A0A5C6BWM5_9BACT|nr:O-Antigen ligase [Allorhodopirellula heiligendammensis]
MRWRDVSVLVTLATAAALLVWTTYYPADSTAVEQGGSLGLTCSWMIWVFAGAIVSRIRPVLDVRQSSWWLDVCACGLASWVFLSAWVTAGVFSASSPDVGGDLRAATNEGWWWIAAAGFLVVMRRLMARPDRIVAVFGLMLGLATLLAVHALHQHYVSLPETMREYLRDPDGALEMIGLYAPAGSAARMIYENRLRDGGPTATFALANSLAGPLAMMATLCGGCLVCLLGWFQSDRWSSTTSMPQVAEDGGQRAGDDAVGVKHKKMVLVALLSGVLGLLIIALMATGSRSGVLSVVFIGTWYTMSAVWIRSRRPVRIVLTCMIGLGFAAVVAWWQSGADTWLGQFAQGARATLHLRLLYWRTALEMVVDRPWFGTGPGNFQLVYQKYRDVQGHEMIAEPHNFIIETLACGGWTAAVLLTAGLIAGYAAYRSSMRLVNERESGSVVPDRTRAESAHHAILLRRDCGGAIAVAMAIGACVGLLAVWYYGILSDSLPDFEAHQYAIPAALIVMGIWWQASPSGATGLTMRQCREIAAAATACGLVHLCFSGGWTIPGVSIVLLWLAGIATSVPWQGFIAGDNSQSPRVKEWQFWLPSFALGFVWLGLVVVLVHFSFSPVRATHAAMAEASRQLNTHRITQAESTLRTALQNDPLAQDAAVWLAEIENRKWLRRLAMSGTPLDGPSQVAEAALADAILRAGNNPTLLRAIGETMVQRYQVGGRTTDLIQANEIFSRAISRSPTQEALVAQRAEIVRELTAQGVPVDGDSAGQLVARAEQLAASGEMVTRKLELQPILPARVIGQAALAAPVRAPAAEVLRGQADGPQ